MDNSPKIGDDGEISPEIAEQYPVASHPQLEKPEQAGQGFVPVIDYSNRDKKLSRALQGWLVSCVIYVPLLIGAKVSILGFLVGIGSLLSLLISIGYITAEVQDTFDEDKFLSGSYDKNVVSGCMAISLSLMGIFGAFNL